MTRLRAELARRLRYPWNLATQGIWTDCRHERRRCVKKYFAECIRCGAILDDYHYTD